MVEVKWRFSGGMKQNYYAIYQNVNQYLVEVDRNKVLNSMCSVLNKLTKFEFNLWEEM